MMRMEMACFMVVAFMAIIYFSAKREKSKLHTTFSVLLITTMFHLIFDAATIYTVNHLDTVPGWLNDGLHRLFISTMLVIFNLIYRYIILLAEEESAQNLGLSHLSTIMLVVALIGVFTLPIQYMETELGNYSYGKAADITYACVAIYVFLIIVSLICYWKYLHKKKRIAICTAMAILIIVSVYQALSPMALISGMAIMLINLSFFLTLENPDILLVKQVEKEKARAEEANAAKSIFLSHVSHEIRTPMNAIVGMTEILLHTDLNKEQKEYLYTIKSSGNALVLMINDILDTAKIEAGKMELIEEDYDLRSVLKDIQMIIRNRIGDKPVELVFRIEDQLPKKLHGDALRIRQIIINLLNNATKYTDVGRIILSVRQTSKNEKGIEMSISVSDSGQGIRKEDLKKLFEAFEQVNDGKNHKKEGTGLGLSISSQLVSLMGGKLEVKSIYGEGSDFYFTIFQQYAQKEPEEEIHESIEDTYGFMATGARILIVEDNEINRIVATHLIKPLGVQVDVATNGKEALDMIGKKKYHLVFMDHMMPIMDGAEAVKKLRQMEGDYYQTLPVIALTANTLKETELMLRKAGMNDFLTKPVVVESIHKKIKEWLPQELIEEIKGINIVEGFKHSGGRDLFYKSLDIYYKTIDTKVSKLEKCLRDRMIRDFTIEVHALKNSSRLIGAQRLSDMFGELEELGNANQVQSLEEKLPAVLEVYGSYKDILEPYALLQKDLRDATIEELIHYLEELHESIENFDIDGGDKAMNQLEACRMPKECRKLMEKLRVCVAEVALEDILHITEEMIIILKEEK